RRVERRHEDAEAELAQASLLFSSERCCAAPNALASGGAREFALRRICMPCGCGAQDAWLLDTTSCGVRTGKAVEVKVSACFRRKMGRGSPSLSTFARETELFVLFGKTSSCSRASAAQQAAAACDGEGRRAVAPAPRMFFLAKVISLLMARSIRPFGPVETKT